MDIFYQYIEPLVHWLHLHPHWAGIFTFFISFGESLAIVGTIVPGTVTMTAIGVLIGSGVIPLYSTFLFAVLGAIAGDSGSYFLGYYYHMKIIEYWPFNKYPNIITKGKSFFILHGGKSVFFGRFIGPIRAIIPLIAGIMHMPNGRFLVANVASAILWSLLYIVPGIVIGAATTELSAEAATRFLFSIFLALITIWLITWCFKVIITTIKHYTVKHLTQFWQWLNTHPTLQALAMWLADPAEPHALTQLYLSLFALLSFITFVVITVSVAQHGFITQYNTSFFYLAQSMRFPVLDKSLTFLTTFGEKFNILPLSLIVSLYLYHKRHTWSALHLLSVTITSAIAIFCIKHAIHFPRPTGLVAVKHSFSFPSGHTAISLPVIGFIAFLLSKQTTFTMKRFIWYPAMLLLVLIGFSRLYLGAHWISDVLGAFTLTGFILLSHIISYQRKPSDQIAVLPLASLSLASFLIIGMLLNYLHFNQDLANNQLKQPITTISLSTWWDQDKNVFPLFRNNRLGQPINMINIQWAAPLGQIKSILNREGWQSQEKESFSETIADLITKKAVNRFPLLQPLYRNQSPVLSMAMISKQGQLILLYLWPSRYEFDESKIPLWVGSIYQRKADLLHSRFLNHSPITNVNIVHPEAALSDVLQYFDWKTKRVKQSDSKVLLIKTR